MFPLTFNTHHMIFFFHIITYHRLAFSQSMIEKEKKKTN